MKLTEMRRHGTDIHVLEYHPYNEGIALASVGNKNRTPVSKMSHKWFVDNGYKPVAAVNGMFFGFQTKADTYGLDYRDAGAIAGDTTLNDVWNELIYQDGKFIIDDIVAADIPKKYPRAAWVMSLSYTLVLNGKKDIRKSEHFDHAKYPNPRAMWGQRLDGTIVKAVTDGRDLNDRGLTVDEQAQLMLDLGCYIAINADGGGSATLVVYVDGKPVVVNDLAGSERAVAQALMLYSKNDIKIERGDPVETKKRVGYDIGHSEDTYDLKGAKGVIMPNGVAFEEFHFNLDVGHKAVKLCLDDGRFEVFLGQPLDNTTPEVDINRRVKFYDDNKCEAIFSCHADASPSASANGKTAFYGSTNGLRMARMWEKYSNFLLPEVHNRGVLKCEKGTWTSFGIVLNTKGVAMLAEHGFFTNAKDRALLLDDDYRTRCAYASYYTLCEYFGFTAKFVYNKATTIEVPKSVINPRLEALTYLRDNNLINDFDQWSKKLDEKADNWLVFEMVKRLHELIK